MSTVAEFLEQQPGEKFAAAALVVRAQEAALRPLLAASLHVKVGGSSLADVLRTIALAEDAAVKDMHEAVHVWEGQR